MHLSVDALKKMNGFAGGPVLKKVRWEQDGETYEADVHVRRLSYHTVVSDLQNFGQSQSLIAAKRLTLCLCDEVGAPIFSVADITGINEDGTPIMVKDDETGEMVERGAMNSNLVNALLTLVGEVSGLGKSTKNSRRKSDTGMN